MIQVYNTPNFAGVTISGDFNDLDQLYHSLHEIVGEEGEYIGYEEVRLRVLGLCYDLRHAIMGNRGFDYVDNGLDEDQMKYMGIVGSKKNLYLTCNTYYPEILFITIVLNDFINIYKRSRKIKYPEWDPIIAPVKILQSSVVHCLKKTLTEHTFKMMINNMNPYFLDFSAYTTQYLDLLNIKFLSWDPEKRKKNISRFAKQIAEKGKEYQNVKNEVVEAAAEYGCSPSEIRYKQEYPEEIHW